MFDVPSSAIIEKNIRDALDEDIGSGDLSARLLPNHRIRACIKSREEAILCGQPWAEAVFAVLGEKANFHWFKKDGDLLAPDEVLCEIEAPAHPLLSAERTMINFLQLLSATATITWQYVQQVKGLDVDICDTRKTIPGLRQAQKYAVRVGGGKNQRMGLYDAILIKENHILAAGGITPALQQALTYGIPVQIEVETLDQLQEALLAGATSILLDNFHLGMIKEAVTICQGKALLEVSGGVTFNDVRTIAETGINRISIGALTKNVRAVDLSMRFIQ
jgi:nicotinate-nucleotide pyrophosphorylase (carboxylating)